MSPSGFLTTRFPCLYGSAMKEQDDTVLWLTSSVHGARQRCHLERSSVSVTLWFRKKNGNRSSTGNVSLCHQYEVIGSIMICPYIRPWVWEPKCVINKIDKQIMPTGYQNNFKNGKNRILVVFLSQQISLELWRRCMLPVVWLLPSKLTQCERNPKDYFFLWNVAELQEGWETLWQLELNVLVEMGDPKCQGLSLAASPRNKHCPQQSYLHLAGRCTLYLNAQPLEGRC